MLLFGGFDPTPVPRGSRGQASCAHARPAGNRNRAGDPETVAGGGHPLFFCTYTSTRGSTCSSALVRGPIWKSAFETNSFMLRPARQTGSLVHSFIMCSKHTSCSRTEEEHMCFMAQPEASHLATSPTLGVWWTNLDEPHPLEKAHTGHR